MASAYRYSTRLLSVLMVLVGLALVVTTLARGGGGLAVGVVLGAMLAMLGGARLLIARRASDSGRA